MQSPDILLIDANAIGYACMFIPELAKLKKDGRSTAALHGLPASIFRIMRMFPSATPIIMWDGDAKWRSDLYPGYKANRDADPAIALLRKQYKAQGPHLRQMFHRLGLPQVAEPAAEADDVAGLITRNAPVDMRILMVTTDTGDWVQALRPNVSLFNPRTDTIVDLQLINSDKFKNGPFRCPEQYLTAKCMAGDISDSITGIDGIGLKTGVKLIEKYGGLENLWALADAGEVFKSKREQTVASPGAREIYWRNRKLMDWREAELPHDIKIYGKTADANAFQAITEEFGLVDTSNFGHSLINRAMNRGWYDQWHTHGRQLRQIMMDRTADREYTASQQRYRAPIPA